MYGRASTRTSAFWLEVSLAGIRGWRGRGGKRNSNGNKKGPEDLLRSPGPSIATDCCGCLLDRDLAARHGGLLGQRELEHAVGELRGGPGLVQVLRQREAAGGLAEGA